MHAIVFDRLAIAGEHQFVAAAALGHRVAVAEALPVVAPARIEDAGAIAEGAGLLQRRQHRIADELAAVAHALQQQHQVVVGLEGDDFLVAHGNLRAGKTVYYDPGESTTGDGWTHGARKASTHPSSPDTTPPPR